MLAPLGRLRGLRAIYPEFDTPHRHAEPAAELVELIETSAAPADTRPAAR